MRGVLSPFAHPLFTCDDRDRRRDRRRRAAARACACSRCWRATWSRSCCTRCGTARRRSPAAGDVLRVYGVRDGAAVRRADRAGGLAAPPRAADRDRAAARVRRRPAGSRRARSRCSSSLAGRRGWRAAVRRRSGRVRSRRPSPPTRPPSPSWRSCATGSPVARCGRARGPSTTRSSAPCSGPAPARSACRTPSPPPGASRPRPDGSRPRRRTRTVGTPSPSAPPARTAGPAAARSRRAPSRLRAPSSGTVRATSGPRRPAGAGRATPGVRAPSAGPPPVTGPSRPLRRPGPPPPLTPPARAELTDVRRVSRRARIGEVCACRGPMRRLSDERHSRRTGTDDRDGRLSRPRTHRRVKPVTGPRRPARIRLRWPGTRQRESPTPRPVPLVDRNEKE